MDNKRFDSLTKALASGQSRRSVIKGLLGLGGAAAVATVLPDDTDARRSRLLSTPQPTTTTAAPCPPGTAVCSTNVTGCCADCPPNDAPGRTVVCERECCFEELECCDGECCAPGDVCLARVYNKSTSAFEERCCPVEETCDGGCCRDGICYWELIQTASADDDDDDDGLEIERSCCPPSGTFCPFMGYDDIGVCCEGDTPICCRVDGYPVCIAEDQCCTASDCPGLEGQGEEACWNCTENTCVPVPRGDQGGCDDCWGCSGIQECVANPTANGEPCGGGFGDDDDGGGVCCGGTCCGGSEPACCTRDDVSFCIDEATQCCLNRDCPDRPDTCEKGICRKSDQTCIFRNECEDNEACCVNAPEPVCVDVSQPGVCCSSDDCDNGCLACEATVCVAQCDRQACCQIGDKADWYCKAEGGCCTNEDCDPGCACNDGSCVCLTTPAPTTTTQTPCPPNTTYCSGTDPNIVCCGPGTGNVCNPATGGCVQCLGNDDCIGVTVGPLQTLVPICDTTTNLCVQCLQSSDCPADPTNVCQAFSCNTGTGFCFVDGAITCPEVDGNVCTVPNCDPDTGCFESYIGDGFTPDGTAYCCRDENNEPLQPIPGGNCCDNADCTLVPGFPVCVDNVCSNCTLPNESPCSSDQDCCFGGQCVDNYCIVP